MVLCQGNADGLPPPYRQPMPKPTTGLPSRKQILDSIASSEASAGKRELARAFGLKGQEKIALKALLRDMANAANI